MLEKTLTQQLHKKGKYKRTMYIITLTVGIK